MKKAILLSIFLLSGCFKDNTLSQSEAFAWAVAFCQDKEGIRSYENAVKDVWSASVRCNNGTSVEVPDSK